MPNGELLGRRTFDMAVIDEAFRQVLAAIGAHDVKEIDPFD